MKIPQIVRIAISSLLAWLLGTAASRHLPHSYSTLVFCLVVCVTVALCAWGFSVIETRLNNDDKTNGPGTPRL